MKIVIILCEFDCVDLFVLNVWCVNWIFVDMFGSLFCYVNVEVDDKWFDVYLLNCY